MVLKKYEIEAALHAEHQAIREGQLKEDNPLDQSEEFRQLCEACRRGDLKTCQEKLQEGVNINARDRFDYTPLILASLCGHYEVCQLLLESGALCERDTFQGERCLYNALNDRIRNLLLSYDYSKSRDPLQPLASHLTSLLSVSVPQTSDITLTTDTTSFKLHKFILAARSPYFAKKLAASPDTTTWKVPPTIPSQSLEIAILGLYLSEVNLDFGTSEEEQAILAGIDKLGKQLEIDTLLDTILEPDRRIQRQKRTQEVERGRLQLEGWFRKNVLEHGIEIDRQKADDVKWDRQNNVFADVLLCATEDEEEHADLTTPSTNGGVHAVRNTNGPPNGIPVGPTASTQSRSPSRVRRSARSVLFPTHRAMLLRSEYFNAMFSSPFKEAQESEHLPIVHVDCNPAVLKVILAYLYTEQASFGLDVAIDVLFASDFLMIEKLKVKAGMIISTLGNGASSVVESENPRGETHEEEEDVLDIYDVVRAGWQTRVHRLEEFGARYIAYRLERYIDREEFKQLVRESAARIKGRQETDTVELIDDIRFYLSDRFRLRFEDAGIDEMTEEEQAPIKATADAAEHDKEGHVQDGAPLEAHVTSKTWTADDAPHDTGVIRTLDGDEAGDEFAQDALNYQILLGKIDTLLENLDLDA